MFAFLQVDHFFVGLLQYFGFLIFLKFVILIILHLLNKLVVDLLLFTFLLLIWALHVHLLLNHEIVEIVETGLDLLDFACLDLFELLGLSLSECFEHHRLKLIVLLCLCSLLLFVQLHVCFKFLLVALLSLLLLFKYLIIVALLLNALILKNFLPLGLHI